MSSVRIGLVGYDLLQEKIINSLSKYSFVKIVGATNIKNDDENTVINKGILIYKDFETLIENEKPHILSICTPLESRFEFVEKAINKKIDTIFEEPLTLDPEKIYRLKNALDKTLAIPLNDTYYHPVLLDVQNYIYENEVGLPISINYKRFVQNPETFSLLYLLAGVIHFARKIFNSEVIDAFSFFTKEKSFSVINLIFKNNTIANINLGRLQINPNEQQRDEIIIDVIGTDGIIISRPSENTVLLYTKKKMDKIYWEENGVSNFVKFFIKTIQEKKDYTAKLLNIDDEIELSKAMQIILKGIESVDLLI